MPTCRFCGFGDFSDIECPELRTALTTYVIMLVTFISGTVEAFDQAAYKARLALLLEGFSAESITLTVQPASIKVIAEISTTSKDVADQVVQALGPYRADPAAASKALGVTVESMEPIAVEERDRAGQTAGSAESLLVLGVLLALVSVLILIAVCAWCQRRYAHMKRRPQAVPVQPDSPTTTVVATGVVRGRDDNEVHWEWPSARLRWGEQLGKGSFGSVFVVCCPGLPSMAAKRVDVTHEPQAVSQKLRRELRREAAFMRSEYSLGVPAQMITSSHFVGSSSRVWQPSRTRTSCR